MDDLERGRLVAFADQLEAIKRDKDAGLRRELEEGPDPGWWVGFDCGHAGDLPIPELAISPHWREYAERTARMMSALGGHQWTVEEVVLETGRVAAAIRAAG